MRKTTIFFLTLAAAGAMMFVGCKKDYQTVTLGVELEGSPANGKVVIDANHNPVILDGDMVNVNGTEYPVTVSGSKYVVDVNAATDGYYYAAYPASLTAGFSGTTAQSVHMSRWQAYKHNNGVQDVQLPAGAVIANDGSKKLKFYNLGSLLEIQWKNTSSVAYEIIGIEVTVPGVALYGDGQATLAGTSSSMTLSDPKKNRVNLDIDEDDRETVAPNGRSRKYYVFLPKFSNKQVTVEIQTMKPSSAQTTSDDQKLKTVTVQTGSTVTLERNKIVPVSFEGAPKENNELTGYFSVRGDGQGNDTYKVVFSRGNLQHVGTAEPNTGTWKFADRQYDFFALNNLTPGGYQISTTEDLFAWSFDYSGDDVRDNMFGVFTYDWWSDFGDWTASGTFADWGKFKTISGDAPETWHTLTSDEWFYLLHTRVGETGDNLRGKAKITGIVGHPGRYSNGTVPTEVYGFILLPDDWTSDDVPAGLNFTPASAEGGANTYENVYSISEWARMEAAGAMFLPAAGYAEPYDDDDEEDDGSIVVYDQTNKDGHYWSSTKFQSSGARPSYSESHYLAFQYNNYYWHLQTSTQAAGNGTFSNYDMNWYYMRSVRLVKPAPGYTDPDGRSTVNQ